MEDVLRGAGFDDVTTLIVHAPLRLSSAAECVRFERQSFGALQQMSAALPAADLKAAWEEIERELQTFQGATGFEAPAELVVGAGTR